jgi:tetratricopeptide (TPR) repeat protein
MGLSVQLTQASHDGGVDLHVIDPTPIRGGRYIVQAKRYQGGVGEPIMRDLYGTLLHSGAVKAILITTGYFTEGAVAFAYGKPIELVDGNALGRLIDQYQLHHEFSGDAISPNSADPLSSVTADELLAEYAKKPSDDLLGPILEQLSKEKRHEDVVEFGTPHLEQLFRSASHCSTYFRSLVDADRLDRLPMALKQLWTFHFDYLPRILVHSVFLLVDRELTQRHFAGVIQTVVQTTESDPAKCTTLAKAYLLLDDRPRSLEWLTRAMEAKSDDAECLCLLAAYEIVRGQHSEALNHLTRSIQTEPYSIAGLRNYQAAKSVFKNAFVQFADVSEWFLLCVLSEKELVCLDEVPELKAEVRRSILEEILEDDSSNIKVREALLPLLSLDEQIEQGEKLAYEIPEATTVARILQWAYQERALSHGNIQEAKRQDIARGLQWTRFLYDSGIRDAQVLIAGALLIGWSSSGEKGTEVTDFLKNHLDLVRKTEWLRHIYCSNLEPKDAISFLHLLLFEKRCDFSKSALLGIHFHIAYFYREVGDHENAIANYKLGTNFDDKESVGTYLHQIREMKGKPAAYREALRLLEEYGETLATLNGIAKECFWNGLRTDEIRYLKKAIAIAPSDPDLCDDLSNAYMMLDQQEEASYWNKKAILLARV